MRKQLSVCSSLCIELKIGVLLIWKYWLSCCFYVVSYSNFITITRRIARVLPRPYFVKFSLFFPNKSHFRVDLTKTTEQLDSQKRQSQYRNKQKECNFVLKQQHSSTDDRAIISHLVVYLIFAQFKFVIFLR